VRRHHPARAAPRRPEIHDDRNVALADVSVEIRVGELDRVAGEERLLAAAAFTLGRAFGEHPVYGGAVGTNDVDRGAHGGLMAVFRIPANMGPARPFFNRHDRGAPTKPLIGRR
jgi:hypothetical protein